LVPGNILREYRLFSGAALKAWLKLKSTGATETPANAYKLLFNRRFNCKPAGTANRLPLPLLEKIKLLLIPAYLSRNHLLFVLLLSLGREKRSACDHADSCLKALPGSWAFIAKQFKQNSMQIIVRKMDRLFHENTANCYKP
jgi:hypothetical protein